MKIYFLILTIKKSIKKNFDDQYLQTKNLNLSKFLEIFTLSLQSIIDLIKKIHQLHPSLDFDFIPSVDISQRISCDQSIS
jgi:hypothetical protein